MPVRSYFQQLICALILIGVLVACSDSGTAAPIATLTLIPATITPTPIPRTATPILSEAIQPDTLVLTPSPTPLTPILETSINFDAELTHRIRSDLAALFDINVDRVQLVAIEETHWYEESLGCDIDSRLSLEDKLFFEQDSTVAGYRYVLLLGRRIYEYHTIGTEYFTRCKQTSILADDLLLTVDPIAAEMLSLVQQRLARELDLPLIRIQTISITPYNWKDSSLGCPLPEQTYTAADLGGYRIVVSAGTTSYIFHTDFTNAIPCEPDQEQLPSS